MRILITGATGFIGRHLFLKLKKTGYEVEGLSLEKGVIDGKKMIVLDLQNKNKLRHLLKGKMFDVIIHLAAKIPQSINSQDAKNSLKENFQTTFNLLEEFNKTKTKKFIYASSMSVVGSPEYLPVDEKHPVNPDNFYSVGKLLGEILCERFKAQTKKNITILRISAPYGPGQNENCVIPLFIRRALASRNILIYGTGKRTQDFIYTADVTNAFLAAIRHNCPGIYNIGSGESTSTLDLAKIILKNIKHTTSNIVLSGREDPQENYKMEVDISKAKRNLKFLPKVFIDDGIKKYINYFINQKNENWHNFRYSFQSLWPEGGFS